MSDRKTFPYWDSETLYSGVVNGVDLQAPPVTCNDDRPNARLEFPCVMQWAYTNSDGMRSYYCRRHQNFVYDYPVSKTFTYRNGDTNVR